MFYGVPARKVELAYKKDQLYLVFVGFFASDTPVLRKKLEKAYGAPSVKGQKDGTYPVIWRNGNRALAINRDGKSGHATITLVDYKTAEIPED